MRSSDKLLSADSTRAWATCSSAAAAMQAQVRPTGKPCSCEATCHIMHQQGQRECRQALFRCEQCGHEVTAKCERSRVEEPTTCPSEHCRQRFSFRLVHNRSRFANKQIIKMQVGPYPPMVACLQACLPNRMARMPAYWGLLLSCAGTSLVS